MRAGMISFDNTVKESKFEENETPCIARLKRIDWCLAFLLLKSTKWFGKGNSWELACMSSGCIKFTSIPL